MESCFIITDSVQKFGDLCDDLVSPDSLIGASLAVVTGPAGRGKTMAARRYAVRTDAIYVSPLSGIGRLMLVREICFDLCGLKPGRIETCLEFIGAEMARRRRLVLVDEADLLAFPVLEFLRNLNERLAMPLVLIGEEDLNGRIASRRRISSRVRRRLEFSPVGQAEIALLFKKALGKEISPGIATVIQKFSRGDWRIVVTLASDVERAMKIGELEQISLDLIRGLIDGHDCT